MPSEGYEHKELPVLAVIKINTSKGIAEVILRDSTNITESVDRLMQYGNMKIDMKGYLEGYLFGKL